MADRETYGLFRYALLILALLIINNTVITYSQPPDSTLNSGGCSFFLKEAALPAGLLLAGIALNHSRIEINLSDRVVDRLGPDYHTDIDDYLQYAPVPIMYIADIAGIESENHWFDQTKNLVVSVVVTSLITRSLKQIVGKTRPTGAPYAFPSGHTSNAFANATVLYHEFRDTSPVIAYSGFAFSTATGALRIVNNRHWLSDVLFGAGTGMLVTHLVYRYNPLGDWNPFIQSKNVTLVPVTEDNYTGLYFSFRF